MGYKFDSKNTNVLNALRSPKIYDLNLAKHMALLSDDASVVRYFFTQQIKNFEFDTFTVASRDMFLGHYEEGQAYVYFGIIPTIVRSLTHLLTSNGFNITCEDKDIETALRRVARESNLQDLFSKGVYYEKGLGDFAYRISYSPDINNKPIIDIIEPQNLEVLYQRGRISGFIISEPSDDNPELELCEIHCKDKEGNYLLLHMFRENNKLIPSNDTYKIDNCLLKFPHLKRDDLQSQIMPFNDWLVIFKKNNNPSRLYKGERGVPSIQGLDTIEDALSESASDLVDAIRKGGVKEFISDELIPQDENGKTQRYDSFNKRIITTRGSGSPEKNKALFETVHGDIRWEAYTNTMQNLISMACVKALISPTTIGQTGLESINSSVESQDAREKPSLRHRADALQEWGEQTLPTLLNRYLQVCDYIAGREILDYSGVINISFNDWNNPTQENLTQTLISLVTSGLKSKVEAIMDLNKGISEIEAEQKLLQILDEQNILSSSSNGKVVGITPEKNVNLGDSDLDTANSGIATINANLANRDAVTNAE